MGFGTTNRTQGIFQAPFKFLHTRRAADDLK